MQACLRCFAVVMLALAGVARAEWQEPKDGKLTEKQVTGYVQCMKDTFELLRSYGKDVDKAKTDAGKMAVILGADGRYKAMLARNGFTEAEWAWVQRQVEEAWGIAMWDEGVGLFGDMVGKLKEQQKEVARQMKEAQDTLAAHEAALKAGKRVLTREQRDEAINSAKSDLDSAQNDVKSANDEVKAAQEEMNKHLADAKAADEAAKSPPKDVEKDDLPGYIEGKKNEAKEAREAAGESQKAIGEAQGKVKEAQARVALAQMKMANPDVPLTDEEKQQARTENEQEILQARATLDNGKEVAKSLEETMAQLKKDREERAAKLPEGNLELVRKHAKEISDMFTAAMKAADEKK